MSISLKRGFGALLPLLLLASCALLAGARLDRLYGPPDPSRFDQPRALPGGVSYRQQVQPILARRCVACHACYDAPCQLKLTAWEGVARGASKTPVYDGRRLLEAPPSRLFEDAQGASAWRQRGFFPVLNERSPGPEAHLAGSLIHRSLTLKAAHPLDHGPLPAAHFDFDINRPLVCPTVEEFEGYARDHPQWGMPYALPAIPEEERKILMRWLGQGAPGEPLPPLPQDVQRQIQTWERFFNGDSLKEQLMSRYLFEHLFLAHLHFDRDGAQGFFRLVRSATPPGTPIQLIPTRRPYDDPGVPRVWYRLRLDPEVVVAKTHMPYRLDDARLARWRGWFLAPDYPVTHLPSYDPKLAVNPFEAFAALPVSSRYRFMIDEAAFTVMGFIKGPVCRGQVALNVINDHFWVFFADPDLDSRESAEAFLQSQAPNLSLPAGWSNRTPLLLNWLRYSRQESAYLAAKSRYLERTFSQLKITPALIWNGNDRNPNAALTVFRHLDSATVVQGLEGGAPKTAWVLTYPLLERIHYLLVAGYDVYGSVGHQLESRLYMDFLRMEGEFNFLAFLPKALRQETRDYWYRETGLEEKIFVHGTQAHLDVDSDIPFRTANPQAELYALLSRRLAPALEHRARQDQGATPPLEQDLAALAGIKGKALSWLAENTVLRLERPGQAPAFYSLLRNTGHLNVSQIFDEARRLAPEENTLSVLPGIVGAYPNAILRLPARELPTLVQDIAALNSEADYRSLADRYALRRSAPDFWAASDEILAAYTRAAPLESGVLDYSRMENR